MSDHHRDNFRIAENASRREELRKPEGVQTLIDSVNRALGPLEDGLPLEADCPPTIFIFGLPRSGTTLCQQLLAYCLDVGYINNFVARFWKAPVHGIAVAADLASQLPALDYEPFESRYGKTSSPLGVHEFSYFWHDVLEMRTTADLRRFGRPNDIDWANVRRRVCLIAQAFGKPTVFKSSFAAHFLQDFAESMPKPLFVHVRRDLADVAVSILRARVAYYDNPNVWWSMYPPDYSEAEGDFARQIAQQVVGLDRYYCSALTGLEPEQLVDVSYETFAMCPGKLLDDTAARLKSLYGTEVRHRRQPPGSFSVRRSRPRSPDEAAVVDAVQSLLAEG